jgi:hypothetical protein
MTGHRYQAALALKAEVPAAVRATINALHEENVTVVRVPHGRIFGIPTELYAYLTGENDELR